MGTFCGHDQGSCVPQGFRERAVEGDGFPRQLKAIREYAAAHDIKIVTVYREESVSGTKESADRPAWSELMTALHANGVRVVLAERLDRLARDLMVQET